jgi:hypothetical protein
VPTLRTRGPSDHAVYDKEEASTVTRPFLISIFKEASLVEGVLVPHRFTQPIPACYPRESALHKVRTALSHACTNDFNSNAVQHTCGEVNTVLSEYNSNAVQRCGANQSAITRAQDALRPPRVERGRVAAQFATSQSLGQRRGYERKNSYSLQVMYYY